MMKKFLLLFLMLPFLGFGQITAGSYIINNANSDSNFKTLTAAVTYINTVGVSGPVTFLLDENQTVTSQIEIKQFAGTSSTNTLTIKPNVGKQIAVSGNIYNGAVIAFNNADNIIIDGEGTLNINNSNNFGYGTRAGIWLYNGSDNNKIQNLNINLDLGSITVGMLSVGIFAGGNRLSMDSKGNNLANTIKNVVFKKVKQAIVVIGNDQNNAYWTIVNNTIESTDNNSKAFLGIYILNASNYNVSGNNVNGIRIPKNFSGNTSHSGIYLENANGGVIEKNIVANIESNIDNGYGYGIFVKGSSNKVYDNSIKNLNSTSTNDGSYGIRSEGNNITIYNNDIANIFSSEGKNTNGIYISGDNQLVYNNFINDVKSAGGGGTDSQNGFGIYIKSGSVVRLYYNTVVLKTNQKSGVSAALFINMGSHLDIRNNIFANMQTSSSTKRFAIYYTANGASNFDFLDFNDYYSNQHIGSWGDYSTLSNIKSTLTDWRAVSYEDGGSIDLLPNFLNISDLHLQTGTVNDALKVGTSISGIATDIDGNTRDSKKPYMGADEIVCTLPVPAILTTEPTCEAAGTAKITNYSSANTYEFLPIGPSVGTDGVISDIISGVNYKVAAKNGNCISVTSLSFFVTSQTTVFNGSWSTPPTPNLSAIIQSQYSSKKNGKLNVCSLTITNNSAVTINKENSFTVQNNVIVDMGSSLTIESDANLIQINNAAPANSGNITVLRDIKIGVGRTQYNYLGSPVTFASGQNLKTIYPGITFALYHVESNNFFGNSSGANIPGRGLAVKEPTTTGVAAGTTVVTAQYKGVPQNGEIRFALANSNTDTNSSFGYNLLGNPYPSNIDLTKLYDLNGGDHAKGKVSKNIDATFYLWDNEVNNDIALAQQGSAYKGQAYAVYNVLAGSKGTGTSAAGYLNNNIIGAKKPVQVLKVGQGFMTKARGKNYTLIFNNSIRTDAEVKSNFLGRAQSQDAEDDRFWLKLISPANLTSTMAVVYYEGGGNTFGAEDSESKLGSDDIFSLVDDQKVAVNGKSSFVDTDRIALGTQHFQAGIYTIGLEAKEGVFAQGQPIYLKDKQTGSVKKLTDDTYSFEVEAGETADRFEIIYQPETVLVTDTKTKESVVVYRDADQFIIKAQKRLATVFVDDLSGKMIKVLKPHQKEVALDANQLSSGVYVLSITAEDGEVFNRKISK